jgi:hypothetical protein
LTYVRQSIQVGSFCVGLGNQRFRHGEPCTMVVLGERGSGMVTEEMVLADVRARAEDVDDPEVHRASDLPTTHPVPEAAFQWLKTHLVYPALDDCHRKVFVHTALVTTTRQRQPMVIVNLTLLLFHMHRRLLKDIGGGDGGDGGGDGGDGGGVDTGGQHDRSVPLFRDTSFNLEVINTLKECGPGVVGLLGMATTVRAARLRACTNVFGRMTLTSVRALSWPAHVIRGYILVPDPETRRALVAVGLSSSFPALDVFPLEGGAHRVYSDAEHPLHHRVVVSLDVGPAAFVVEDTLQPFFTDVFLQPWPQGLPWVEVLGYGMLGFKALCEPSEPSDSGHKTTVVTRFRVCISSLVTVCG